MKYLYTIIVSLVLVLYLTSCGNQLSKAEQEFDATMQNVIDAHDEVMPKMGNINSLIQQLESKIDTTTTGQAHQKVQKDLKDAYDFMMNWMEDFSEKFPYEEKDKKFTPEELAKKLRVLKEEEIEVQEMRDQINTSILKAENLLKS